MQIKSKSFLLLAVAILLFSNCAIYYFSAKHLEPGKYEIGLGGNKSFQKEYSISNGINFLNDGLWTAPPIYIYLKTGLPKEYNLSFGLTSNYAVTGLTAVVSKRVKQFM